MSHGPSNRAAVVAARHLQWALASQTQREAFRQAALEPKPSWFLGPVQAFYLSMDLHQFV